MTADAALQGLSGPNTGFGEFTPMSNNPDMIPVRIPSIDVAPVPEPLTILGAATAVAFGTGFKRKLGKANKK